MTGRGMPRVLDAQHGGGWPPGIARVRTRSEKFIVVPIPVLRHGGRSQCETGEMKTHPGASLLHVIPEGFTLNRVLRASIKKEDHLVAGKNLGVEVGPISG